MGDINFLKSISQQYLLTLVRHRTIVQYVVNTHHVTKESSEYCSYQLFVVSGPWPTVFGDPEKFFKIEIPRI
jgi:hypothetical protein